MRPDVHYARNGDVSLAYQVVGEGPRDMLLVSGFLSNIEYAWIYPSMAAFLSRLASSCRLILMDRRGSGLSDRSWDATPVETTLQDLEVVLDAVGSPRTTLFGIWEGCGTSVLFAATHPERVSALVLFGASAAQARKDDDDDLAGWVAGWDEAGWEEWLRSIREGWGTRSWAVRNARWMGPGMLDAPDELEQWISYTRLSASPSAAEAVMRIDKETDIRQVLPTVQSPTLVLHRTGDQIEPIEAGRYVASKIPNARFVELPGDDGIPWLGNAASVLAEIEAFLGERSGPAAAADRRLGTLLFTDIVGSTEHVAAMGDAAWRKRLAEHDQISKDVIGRSGGRYVDSTGDGLVASFDGPAAAVGCATSIGAAIRSLELEIRAGVHTAELEFDGPNVRGIAVHIGARVMSLAGPGEVLVSSTVKDLVAGSGIAFEDAGEHELKGVPDRWRIYRVVT
jgi:class 3 adenylate cyclase